MSSIRLKRVSCWFQKNWSGRVDLNHRPPGPEPAGTKSLSHRPRVTFGIRATKNPPQIHNRAVYTDILHFRARVLAAYGRSCSCATSEPDDSFRRVLERPMARLS